VVDLDRVGGASTPNKERGCFASSSCPLHDGVSRVVFESTPDVALRRVRPTPGHGKRQDKADNDQRDDPPQVRFEDQPDTGAERV